MVVGDDDRTSSAVAGEPRLDRLQDRKGAAGDVCTALSVGAGSSEGIGFPRCAELRIARAALVRRQPVPGAVVELQQPLGRLDRDAI